MPERLLEVGTIRKAHGLSGEVIVDLTSDRTERLDPGSLLQTDRGALTVLSAAPHSGRYIVRFAEIADRTTAEQWRGTTLRGERPVGDTVWIDQLFGAEVVTVDGVVRGRVVAVEQHPTSDVLVLDTGDLVPMTFCVTVEPNVRVVVDPPAGLFT